MTNTNPSSSALVRVGLITLLIFTFARYSFDSVLLPLMGRSLAQGADFQPYYVAAHMVRDRQNVYDLALQAAQMKKLAVPVDAYLPYLYPPLLAIALVPLTPLPFKLAYRVWVILQQLVLVGVLLLLSRSLPWLGRAALPMLIVLAGNFYPLYQNIDIGQVNLVVLLIFCAALLLYQRAQFFWAGVLIAVGTMLKVSPVLLMGLFVLQRQWRALWGFAAAMVVLLVSFVLINGPDTVISFFTFSLGQAVPAQAHWLNNVSLAAVLYRSTNALHLQVLERPLWYLSVAAILGTLLLLSYKKRTASGIEFALLFSAWVVAGVLLSPISWEHHLVLLLLPLGVLFAAIARLERAKNFIALSVSFGILYLLLAFENVTLQRSGQWNFGTGWWIFTGDYLRLTFFPDIRLFAVVVTFLLLVTVFRLVSRSLLLSPQTAYQIGK